MGSTDRTGHAKRPILELVVDAPRDEVWRAVSTTEGLREWFGYDYDTRHGGRPERPAADLDSEVRAFVEDSDLVPPERVVFDDSELTLTADDRRTVVRLVVPEVADAAPTRRTPTSPR